MAPTPKTTTAPTRSARHSRQRPDVPLAVWPVAQTSAQYQGTGRYLPDCSAHPGKMLPALAAKIVTEYTSASQLIVDPMCGIGTSLVEAACRDRRAIGVELEDVNTSPGSDGFGG